MICKELNCVFVHVPKTAGQSIERVLLQRLGVEWEDRGETLLRPNDDPELGPPRLAHLAAGEYVARGYLSGAEFDAMYKFAFVRNPWARLVSEYHYRTFERPLTFREFVLEHFPGPEDDDFAQGDDHYRHVMPQSRFLYGENGDCLVDFIGRFESLQADFEGVCVNLGIGAIELPHVNSRRLDTGRKGRSLVDYFKRAVARSAASDAGPLAYTKMYDEETVAFVTRYYASDIENFGYAFGG